MNKENDGADIAQGASSVQRLVSLRVGVLLCIIASLCNTATLFMVRARVVVQGQVISRLQSQLSPQQANVKLTDAGPETP